MDYWSLARHRLHIAMQIDVRLAAIETKHEFATIVKDADAWQKALGSEGWNGPFDDAWMMPRIDRGELYLGYAGDTPVAACRLLWEDRPFWGDREEGDSVYLHTFAVRRSSAGLGIGGAIIDWVMGMGRQRGRTSVRLDCFLSNARLIAFYERNGFASVGIALTGGKTMNLMERMID